MTNEATNARRTSNDIEAKRPAASSHDRKKTHDRRVDRYTRIKPGDLKKRNVSRAPDMSRPVSKAQAPDVVIGGLPTRTPDKNKAIPVASVHVETTVRTVTDTTKASFPYSVVFLSLICSLLFFYMIFNYVQINEHTSAISDLKADIATLSFETKNLTTKLDQKNDLTLIEQIATEKLGMVKIDEITKKYITLDSDDVITPYGKNGEIISDVNSK